MVFLEPRCLLGVNLVQGTFSLGIGLALIENISNVTFVVTLQDDASVIQGHAGSHAFGPLAVIVRDLARASAAGATVHEVEGVPLLLSHLVSSCGEV
jgi:hypothetical protein